MPHAIIPTGVWDNSQSMKAVCLQHDALPWEVIVTTNELR